MKTVREIIVVEGKYDIAAVKRSVQATVVETGGFGVFAKKEKVKLLQKLGRERGIILLTDSDGAGMVIRSHLKGMLPGICIRQAYIPIIKGKEKRKNTWSKEGLLGVEGMESQVILEALEKCGATFCGEETRLPEPWLTKAGLFSMGLSGKEDSSLKRKALCRKLDLPETLTANGLMEVLNTISSEEEVRSVLED